MFKKTTCRNCGKKISKEYQFCPYCGSAYKNVDNNEWGMLGKEDSIQNDQFSIPPGLNMIFNSLMRSLSKQLDGAYKEPKKDFSKIKKSGISISISTGQNPAKMRIKPRENKQRFVKKMPEQFSKENSKRFANLPREEPKTNIRRLSDKVIYEIELQDVKSMKDISIIRLENSIEIKAIGKNKCYFKRIPINFPIIDYVLSDEKLVLEFEIKN